ncbi:ABC transporter permease [candidate division KSB1 bacterium]
MFKNYLKVTLRNLLKYKAYSLINVSGLAAGMAACILIIAYVQNELSYEKHHTNFENIYRVVERQHYVDRILPVAVTPVPLAPALKEDMPEVLEAARWSNTRTMLVSYQDKKFYEQNIVHVDSSLFKLFNIPLKIGNPDNVLKEKNTCVISEEIAEKYFGEEDPIGMTLKLAGRFEVRITGVLDRLPPNSFIQFDIALSFPTIESIYGRNYLQNWGSNSLHTFILIPENYDHQILDAKLREYLGEKRGERSITKLHLQPLKDLHFDQENIANIAGRIDKKYVYIFLAIAFSLLFIACINFMNLSTARSATRANEVGMRKVVGASRFQLIRQFIGESLVFSFISLGIALLLVKLLLPTFNDLTGKELMVDVFNNSDVLLQYLLLTAVVGLFAGSYPALFLSSFKPVKVLKGSVRSGVKNIVIRKGLVILQFSISIALIISTLVIYKQLNFIRTMDLGINKEQVMILPVRGNMGISKYASMIEEFVSRPDVISATVSDVLPGFGGSSSSYTWEGGQPEDRILLNNYNVGHDFVETFDLEIVEGRNFSREFSTDRRGAVLLNETAVRDIGWTSAIGKKIGSNSTVVGVVKDFHFHSLHNKIEPLIIGLAATRIDYFSVRMNTENVSETVENVKEIWNRFNPQAPFDHFFLDERFDNRYRFESRMQTIYGYFSILTILIACLGLFGLASFTAEQRQKEIGVRKVLGATVAGIVKILSAEFSKLVLISNAIAWPIAYFSMGNWLQGFAYKINMGWLSFLIAAAAAFLISLMTIGYQAVKSAIANPVKALKYE